MAVQLEYDTGQQIGSCFYMYDTKAVNYARYSMFKCHCGNEFEAFLQHVKRGKIVSCGCRKTIKYKKGIQLGLCVYLKELKKYHSPSGQNQRRALFRCQCGNEFEAKINDVKSHLIISCGCAKKKQCRDLNIKHGLWEHRLFNVWASMKDRCFNSESANYKNYGGRGIKVCKEWVSDFKAFYDYMISLPHYGEEGRSIDRIDNNGNYEPRNVRWATWKMQANNKRNNLIRSFV